MIGIDDRMRRMLLHRTLTLRQLEWRAVLAPMAFLAVVYFFVLSPIHPFFHDWYGFVVLAAVLLVAVWFFSRTVFGIVRSLQREVETLNEQTEDYNRQLVSLHGTWMQTMAQAWLIYRLTDSSLMLGVVAFCSHLPVLVLGLLGGVIADRLSRRRLLFAANTVAMMQALAFAVLTLAIPDEAIPIFQR